MQTVQCGAITLSLGLGLLGCAQPVATSRLDALQQTRNALRARVQDGDVPGISYIQVDANGTVLEAHLGAADVADGRPVTAATQFMSYSTIKALTAVAVMQLVEQGRMQLNAPLSRYFEAHPYGEPITVQMLLAHTAGVPNPIPSDWFFVDGEPVDRAQALRDVLAENSKLDDPPGDAYGYSNIGYWLLEKAMEGASGQPYDAYMREHVLAPLGLGDDDVSFALPPATRLATGHIGRWSLMNLVFHVLSPSRYWSDPYGGWSRFARLQAFGLGYGGAYTSARAWAAVLRDLLRPDGVLLQPATKQRMFEAQSTRTGKPTEAALGWVIGELHGQRYFGKQGGGLGFHGNLRVYPSLGIATVFFANKTEVTPGPIDARSDAFDAPMVQWLASSAP